MQVTIEIPDDTPEHMVNHLKNYATKLIDPSYLAIWWNVSDVFDVAENMDIEISVEKAEEVLKYIDHNHDACEGISWYVIESALDRLTE